jgi:hypothetical protein
MAAQGSISVGADVPQGPLRRVGLPLTNGHSPGGSWHGGSVPGADEICDEGHALFNVLQARYREVGAVRFLAGGRRTVCA